MLQSFDNNAQPEQAASRLALLRLEMAKADIDAFIVPREDEFMGEYVPACAERLKWLTGFGGSAGVAIILKNQAALFLDGRYTLEAENYIDTENLSIVPIMQVSVHSWLSEKLEAGDKLAYDPKLHSIAQIKKLSAALDEQNVPEEGRWFLANPEFYEVLVQSSSKLLSVDYNAGQGSIRNGLVSSGKLRGFDMYKSNNIAATTNAAGKVLAGHMSSTATAQTITNTEVLRDPDSFGDIVRGLHVYGAQVLRGEALVSAFYGID